MTSRRGTIGKRLRFAVLERDGFRCRYCGVGAADAQLHLDHHTPVVRGGKDTFENLITACADCNLGKAAVIPIRQIMHSTRMALAAKMFEQAGERFGAAFANPQTFNLFQLMVDLCLAQENPDHLLDVILTAESWEEAYKELFRAAGYPSPEDYWGDGT